MKMLYINLSNLSLSNPFPSNLSLLQTLDPDHFVIDLQDANKKLI
jgi:hypothetical protein